MSVRFVFPKSSKSIFDPLYPMSKKNAESHGDIVFYGLWAI